MKCSVQTKVFSFVCTNYLSSWKSFPTFCLRVSIEMRCLLTAHKSYLSLMWRNAEPAMPIVLSPTKAVAVSYAFFFLTHKIIKPQFPKNHKVKIIWPGREQCWRCCLLYHLMLIIVQCFWGNSAQVTIKDFIRGKCVRAWKTEKCSGLEPLL